MAKYYRSEDDAPIVESPIDGETEGQVMPAVSNPEPDLPPTGPTEPISDVESTREPEADPTVPEQIFRFMQEDQLPAADDQQPAEAPAADVPAPGENPDIPAGDAPAPEEPIAAPDPAPMDVPAPAEAGVPAPAEAPATDMPAEGAPAPGVDGGVAAVPAAAPMVPPQPETEAGVPAPAEAPATDMPAEGAPAPAAPVETPNEPVEEPVDNQQVQCGKGGKKSKVARRRFRQEDGEVITVVETPEPTEPPKTETEECPETGDEFVTKNVNEPINPVVTQADPISDTEEIIENENNDENNIENTEAGGTEPIETEKANDVTVVDPEVSESPEDVEEEIEAATMSFRQAFRMEQEGTNTSDNGDQDVDVHVEVRKDDGDEHGEDISADPGADVAVNGDQKNEEPVPEQRFGFRQENDKNETVADIIPEGGANNQPAPGEIPADAAKTGNTDDIFEDGADGAEQCFNQMFNAGGSWL